MSIEVEGLVVRYGALTALEEVTVSVAATGVVVVAAAVAAMVAARAEPC